MALLLALYQKMKLTRQKNELILEQTKYGSKLDRIQKNIEKTQKYYAGLKEKLKSQQSVFTKTYQMQQQAMMAQQMNSIFGMAGMSLVGQGAFGYGYSGYAATPHMNQWMASHPEVAALMQSGQTFQQQADGSYKIGETVVQKTDIESYYTAKNEDSMQQQQMQMQYSQMQQQVAYNNQAAEQWAQAQMEVAEAQLDAEQEAALEPLNYQETIDQIHKDSVDVRLKKIEQELQNYDQLVSQEAQNSAPKFGLG